MADFRTENIEKAFNKFGKEVIQQARSNLTRQRKNVDKTLYDSLQYNYEGYKGGFRFTISMEDYGAYQDQGVQGTESSAKAPNSPFKFGSGTGRRGGLTKGIDQWVRKRRLQFRTSEGKFMTYNSTAFLIRRSIWKKGIKASKFFEKAFEVKSKRLIKNIEDAFALDVQNLLRFVRRENFS